ncbi:lipoprotein insertase outer membrane protein LolB [Salinispirillum sp. LH 10-3-1]|uniref:Outer-membrane lipoprotein LolB n=1 Tax=Salinispirillum sp. LH 10-3-1 TaxID=2952525 RepID=A0AB38YCQ7_9GAMM
MKLLKHLTLLALILFVAACSTRPAEPVDQAAMLTPWLEHRDKMRALDTWTLQGRVGARTGSEGANFNVYWQQHENDYNIRLSGPLGQGGASISGGFGWAELRTADDVFRARSLDELLSETTSLDLPLHYLQYWMRGIPAPGTRAGIKLNGDALLEQLEQYGWTVLYESYHPDTQLPHRFNIRFEDSSARIIISSWEVTGA